MRKVRLKTYHLAAILLLSILVPMFALIGFSQTKVNVSTAESKNADAALRESCKNGHTDEWEYFVGAGLGKENGVGVLPPVKILEIAGNRLNFAYTNHGGIRLGSVDLEPDYTVIPDKEPFDAKHHSGCYAVHYCRKHLVALQIQTLDQKFCRTTKQ